MRMLDNGSDVAVADSVDVARENTPGTSGGKADVASVAGDVTSTPPEPNAKKRKKSEGAKPPRPPRAPKARSRGPPAQKKGNSFVKEGSASFVEAPLQETVSVPVPGVTVTKGKVERGAGAGIRLKIRPPSAVGGRVGELPMPPIGKESREAGAPEGQVSSPLIKPHMKRQRSKKRHKD